MEPIYPVDLVAKEIVRLSRRPEAEVYVGRAGKALARQHKLAPHRTERSFAKKVDKDHLSKDEQVPLSHGNLYAPMPQYATASGGWRERRGRRIAKRIVRLGVGVAIGAAAYRWYRSQKQIPGQRGAKTKTGRERRRREVPAAAGGE